MDTDSTDAAANNDGIVGICLRCQKLPHAEINRLMQAEASGADMNWSLVRDSLACQYCGEIVEYYFKLERNDLGTEGRIDLCLITNKPNDHSVIYRRSLKIQDDSEEEFLEILNGYFDYKSAIEMHENASRRASSIEQRMSLHKGASDIGHDPSKFETYKCASCPYETPCKRHLKRHVRVHSKVVPKVENQMSDV